MHLSYLLPVALSGLALAARRPPSSTRPPYPTITAGPTGTGTGTGGTIGTISSTGHYTNRTATATASTSTAIPSGYDAFEVLKFPCTPFDPNDPYSPPYGSLTCCELKFDGSTTFSDC